MQSFLKINVINSLYVKSIYYICVCLTIKTYKMKNLATFKTSDFSIKGNEFEARKTKIGFINKYDKKFKAPNQIIIENVGTFTFKSSWNTDLNGKKYIYDSEIFASVNDNHAMRVIFW